MSAPRVLPADVFDYLDLSALAEDGIGAGEGSEERAGVRVPYCVIGHGCFAKDGSGPVLVALEDAGIKASGSDRAVRAINRRNGAYVLHGRVPFAEWARELNVVRGA